MRLRVMGKFNKSHGLCIELLTESDAERHQINAFKTELARTGCHWREASAPSDSIFGNGIVLFVENEPASSTSSVAMGMLGKSNGREELK